MANKLAEALIDLGYNGPVEVRGDTIIYQDESITPPALDVVTARASELEAADPIRILRETRNILLKRSDWTGLSDSALTNEQAAKWKLYRQKLRDLPSGLDTEAKVKNVEWPTKP